MADEPEPLQSLNVSDLWDYSVELEYLHRVDQDLQLAAELGKTLLERNKELETALKQHQNVIEDQAQEIEYLTKQTVALREVNDSRLRIYEQLEVSIQDLERANHRLVLENSAEKKHIKSLNATIESLEAKCEELQTTIDDFRLQIDILKRKSRRSSNDGSERKDNKTATVVSTESLREDSNSWVTPNTSALNSEETGCPTQLPSPKLPSPKPVDIQTDQYEAETNTEQLSQLLTQLSKTRALCARDERRIAELEEQLSTVIQQNQALENQVVQLSHRGNDEGMKSMHEELTTLEEVRQGQLCSRCLRSVSTDDDVIPDDDDSSMLDALMTSQHRTEFTMDIQVHPENQSSPITSKQSANPYKDLVEKYEALAEIHRKPLKSNQSLSLQEEMQMSGEFNTLSIKDTDEESGHGDSLKLHKKSRKTFSTPTDLSEAETSSSGFADETSNKFTQTEGRVGSFLCTIADGEDCKFSIYDDASPIDSRFRDRPEYRDLFKEIFNVLKKAAENKEEGDDLPLLDDYTSGKLMPKVPPVTPSTEQIPEFPDDDTQSVISSTMSELSISQNEPTTVIENIIQAQNQPIPEADPEEDICQKQERVLRPLVRQNLDYISVEVRKRSSSKRKNKLIDRSDSSVTHIIGSPKINYSSRPNSGKKRREQARHNTSADNDGSNWNGNTLQFFSTSRSLASPTPSQGSTKYEFKPSSASQDLHKLKKLDLSYAEVLRNADNKKKERDMNRQRQRK